MAAYREVVPVPGPEAFETPGRDAELSRAALVLSAASAVAGRADRLDVPEALGLPADALGRIGREEKFLVAEAAAPLDVDLGTHLEDRALRMPPQTSAGLARRLVDRPSAQVAAALVEANLHSDSLLVRTAAAVAALDTTGPRQDVLDRLVEGVRSRDRLARQVGRAGLGRVAPQHPALARLVARPEQLAAAPAVAPAAPAGGNQAVVTHGTFAARTTWWRPGGSFYRYLQGLVPPLHPHDPSFGWSGQYSDGARQLAAQQLVTWTAAAGLAAPDFFAHSHGGTVANLSTRRGQGFDRLVLLSWPVHGEWFPDFTKVRRIVDVRVHLDLVILADRGGQTFTPPPRSRSTVASHVNGWFDHSVTNDPAYWERYKLADALLG